MLNVALTMTWADCSEEEIREKVETLNRIW